MRLHAEVVFITEGGRNLGLGHLMRCIAIAEYMSDLKIKFCFFVNKDKAVSDILKKYKFTFKEIKGISQMDITFENKRIIIDSRKDLSKLIKRLKKNHCEVNLIGNTTNARLLANRNIYPYEHFRPSALKWSLPKGKVYYGAEYFPLRKEFLDIKDKGLKKNILVSMGGADHNNLTELVLKSLDRALPGIDIIAVVGMDSKNDIKTIARKFYFNKNYKIIKESGNLVDLLNQAYLLITALGITIYEAAYFGIPIIVINNYKTDTVKSAELERLGLAKSLGYYRDVKKKDISNSVRNLLSEENKNIKKIKSLDGNGAKRIISLVMGRQQQ